MTRTWRWTTSLYWKQLNWAGHSVKLPRRGWPRLAPEHWWWPLPAHNVPFLWAGWRWLGWSHNFHPSSWLRPVIRSRNPSRGLSIGGLVRAGPAGHHRAYVWPLSRPNKRCSPWHRPQHLFWGSANSISNRWALWFYWYQSALPINCRGAD